MSFFFLDPSVCFFFVVWNAGLQVVVLCTHLFLRLIILFTPQPTPHPPPLKREYSGSLVDEACFTGDFMALFLKSRGEWRGSTSVYSILGHHASGITVDAVLLSFQAASPSLLDEARNAPPKEFGSPALFW